MRKQRLALVLSAAAVLLFGCAGTTTEIDDDVTTVTDDAGNTVGIMHVADLNDAIERNEATVPVYDAVDGGEIGVFELGDPGGFRAHDDPAS